MKFTIYQETRIGKRANNEDRLAHCYSRDALLMVVADGMGGHYYGEVAAQIAVQTLTEAFKREFKPRIRDPFMFLQKGMLNAHRGILDFAGKHHLQDSPRTTCVACIVQNNVAYWAHSGDSRLYLLRNLSRGKGNGFCAADDFYPDFILWLVDGSRQRIVFVDPKGLALLKPNSFDHPKIQLYRTLQEIADNLGDPNVGLDSFIISDKSFAKTQPDFGTLAHSREECHAHHVSFPEDSVGMILA